MNYENAINHLKNTLYQAGLLPKAESTATESLMRQAARLFDQAADKLVKVAEEHLKASQAHNGDLNKALSDVLNFEAIAEMLDQYQLESDARDALESPKKSQLVPSGFTFTDTGLHGIAGKIVAYVREQAKGQALTAHVWPYRHDDSHMLSCDFHSKESDLVIPLCITAGQEQCGDPIDEPTVYDLPEALHLAGIIIRAVKADIEIGRYFNETNPAVLTRPLQHRQTNGPIHLWEENHA